MLSMVETTNTKESKMSGRQQLLITINPDLPRRSCWSVTYRNDRGGKTTFFHTITNGWQRSHATPEAMVRWQYPTIGDLVSVTRIR